MPPDAGIDLVDRLAIDDLYGSYALVVDGQEWQSWPELFTKVCSYAVYSLENVERGLGLHASGQVLVALVEQGGLSREAAYEVVQRDALAAADTRRPLRELLAADPAVTAALPSGSLEACFDDAHRLRNVPAVIGRLDALQPLEEAVL